MMHKFIIAIIIALVIIRIIMAAFIGFCHVRFLQDIMTIAENWDQEAQEVIASTYEPEFLPIQAIE